jgi:hypothetical protein
MPKKNQIMFYATAGDLGSVLSPLEAEKPLQYTLTGLFESNKPQTYESYANIPDFGRASHPTAAANQSFLLSYQGTNVRVREVPQKAGGVLFGLIKLITKTRSFSARRGGTEIILFSAE